MLVLIPCLNSLFHAFQLNWNDDDNCCSRTTEACRTCSIDESIVGENSSFVIFCCSDDTSSIKCQGNQFIPLLYGVKRLDELLLVWKKILQRRSCFSWSTRDHKNRPFISCWTSPSSKRPCATSGSLALINFQPPVAHAHVSSMLPVMRFQPEVVHQLRNGNNFMQFERCIRSIAECTYCCNTKCR